MADEHRSRAMTPRLRRSVDPADSKDPGVSAVLAQLEDLAREHATITPRAEFRAELRAQLVAITPRIVAEHAPETRGVEIVGERSAAAVAARPVSAPRENFWSKLRGVSIGRPLAIVATMITVLGLVLGGAVYLSRDAVPGDTLYGLKRAGERVELSFADTDAERAQDYLEFASTRVDEARELATRASASAAGSGPLADGRISDATAALITEALSSADGNTQTAARLLGGQAVRSNSAGALDVMTSWAPVQLERLAKLRAATPTGSPVNTAASQSTNLVSAARTRAAALQGKVDCHCLQNAPTDALGPMPIPTTSVPSAPKTSSPSRTSKPAAPSTPRTRTSAPGVGSSVNVPQPGRTASNPLPSLPLPLPSNSASVRPPAVDLCKINLLGIRICPAK